MSSSEIVFGLAVFLLALVAGCSESKPRVVLYCAQDQEFAEEILADFGKRTGIQVAPKFDTEADKSVSLYTDRSVKCSLNILAQTRNCGWGMTNTRTPPGLSQR